MIFLVKLFRADGKLKCKDSYAAECPEQALIAAKKDYPKLTPVIDGFEHDIDFDAVLKDKPEKADGPGFLKRRKKKHKQIKEKKAKANVKPVNEYIKEMADAEVFDSDEA